MSYILLTGSEGQIGKLLYNDLKSKYNILCIDKTLHVDCKTLDLLNISLEEYTKNYDIDIIIHLAAHPSPNITSDLADDNVKMTEKLIEYMNTLNKEIIQCKESNSYNSSNSYNKIIKFINASTINVYPYVDMINNKIKINKDTELKVNNSFKLTYYGESKIKTENILKKYCKNNCIHLYNLRLGYVNVYNQPIRKFNDRKIELKPNDLVKIINECITNTQGNNQENYIHDFVCISKKDDFVNNDILFPL